MNINANFTIELFVIMIYKIYLSFYPYVRFTFAGHRSEVAQVKLIVYLYLHSTANCMTHNNDSILCNICSIICNL